MKLIDRFRKRFPYFFDEALYTELATLLNFAGSPFLDRHSPKHLFALLVHLSKTHITLSHQLSFNPHVRNIVLKFLPTHLTFSFANKRVLGCFIGATMKSEHETLSCDDLQFFIQKSFPNYQFVPRMSYVHLTPQPLAKMIYFEIEKKSGGLFSLHERQQIKHLLTEKLEEDLPHLVRPVVVPRNQEEVYKNILFLSQEIRSAEDLPHVMISLEQQKGKELVFLVTLVHASSRRSTNLESLFSKENPQVKFVSESQYPVLFLKTGHPVTADIFRLHILDNSSLPRIQGAVHFYEARRYISDLLHRVLGEFRDCNGGLILKVDEQLAWLKSHFHALSQKDWNLIETFFYSIVPLEKQATLPSLDLQHLFSIFLKGLDFQSTCSSDYYFQKDSQGNRTFLSVRIPISPFLQTMKASFEELMFQTRVPIVWSMLEVKGNLSLTLLIESSLTPEVDAYLAKLKDIINQWLLQVAGQRVCRIALAYRAFSLDPRLGSDEQSSNLLRMLFEGLTRFNSKGEIEEAIAESILISEDGCRYLFKLRLSCWNDGQPLTAHDFAYAWRNVLSPDFPHSFAYFLYPIQNAQAVKEGKLPMDQLGVHVLDDSSIEVILEHPVPYFLELLSHPISFPIHREVDKKFPQWTSEVSASYPCNGPFQLMTNHSNYGYQLVKNPLYWDTSSVPIDQVIFLCLKPHEAQILFEQGLIDWLGDPFGTWAESLCFEGNKEWYTLAEQSAFWCLFNTEKFPFSAPKFRKALSLAANPELLYSSLFPQAEFTASPLPKELSQVASSKQNYDPAQAVYLLNEFLEETGIKKEDFPPLTILYADRAMDKSIATKLTLEWSRILGLSFKIEEEPWNLLYPRYKRGDFELGIIRWISRFHDATYSLNAFRYTSGVVNFPKWEHREYQNCLDQADLCQDGKKRKEWLKKAEYLLIQELPILSLFHFPYQGLKKQGVDPLFLNRCGFVLNQ